MKKSLHTILITAFASAFFFVAFRAMAVNLNYPDFASSTSPAEFIGKFYLYALSISGTLAIIMIVYGGVKYVASAGSVASQSDARDIIKNAVFGILLLGGAYLILHTINPDITDLKNPDMEPVEPAPPFLSIDDVAELSDSRLDPIQVAAFQLVGSGVFFDSKADCVPGSDAKSIINSALGHRYQYVCSSSCTKTSGCNKDGTVLLSEAMLTGLKNVVVKYQGKAMMTITSLSGGKHRPGSLHYQGRASDVVVRSDSSSLWGNVCSDMKSVGGASKAICEVNSHYYSCSDCANLFDENGKLKSGAHIHAEW